MLRSLSFAAATAALLLIPFTQADARHGGMSGARISSGHISSMRSFSGPRSIGVRSIGVRSAPLHVGSRRVIVGSHLRHHRRHFFFGGVYAAGLYGTCWRWVPTAFGWRRLWVCDPYPYY